MRETSFAFLRSLWKRAKSTPNRSAMEVALQTEVNGNIKYETPPSPTHRLAPPASGETMTSFTGV
ncbi:unnamed protein product [Somion occarium]|uniref:Uncharacterized protein n=1 Tax=Somion occarium TaxID=3059160 RepID=A0ABP1CJB4_9APHY